jgi:hypothetical protein
MIDQQVLFRRTGGELGIVRQRDAGGTPGTDGKQQSTGDARNAG